MSSQDFIKYFLTSFISLAAAVFLTGLITVGGAVGVGLFLLIIWGISFLIFPVVSYLIVEVSASLFNKGKYTIYIFLLPTVFYIVALFLVDEKMREIVGIESVVASCVNV